MENLITLVGVGPGSPDFLTPAGARAIARGEILVGAPRLIDTFASPEQKIFYLGSNLGEAAEYIKNHYREKRVVVLVSGDPGFYSLARYIRDRFPAEVLVFIPGISSLQLMFARLRHPWEEAVFISRHGRKDERLLKYVKAGLVVAVLTDGLNTPQVLADELIEGGCSQLPVSVGCNLSLESEFFFRGRLEELKDLSQKILNCVVVIGV